MFWEVVVTKISRKSLKNNSKVIHLRLEIFNFTRIDFFKLNFWVFWWCFLFFQMQPSVFYEERCSKKFRKINRKTPVRGFFQEVCKRCCPVNFEKLLRTPFLQNTSGHGTKIRIIVRIIVPCSGWILLFFRYPDSIVTYLFKLNKIRPEQHSTKCGSDVVMLSLTK